MGNKKLKEKELKGTPYEGFEIRRLVEKSLFKNPKQTIDEFIECVEEERHINIKTGFHYKFFNEEKLEDVSDEKNYKSKLWGTYLQYNQLGYSIRKNQKPYTICHQSMKEETDGRGNNHINPVILNGFHNVFNFDQVERNNGKRKKLS